MSDAWATARLIAQHSALGTELEMVALEELRLADRERPDRRARAERGEPGDDPPAGEPAAARRRDGGARIEEYHAVWEELRAATGIAESLLRDVPPEEMVRTLSATGEPPAAVGAELYAMLSWLRAVAAVAEQRAPAGEPPLLPRPFQIKSGLLRHRRREPVEVVWRRPQRPE
jgi:hypothetical protein